MHMHLHMHMHMHMHVHVHLHMGQPCAPLPKLGFGPAVWFPATRAACATVVCPARAVHDGSVKGAQSMAAR